MQVQMLDQTTPNLSVAASKASLQYVCDDVNIKIFNGNY